MLLEAILLGSIIFCQTQAQQGDDMDDEDFAAYVKVHDDFREKYGESFAKGCIGGGFSSAPGGFQALCVGCVMGGAGNVAIDVMYPPKNEKADKVYENR